MFQLPTYRVLGLTPVKEDCTKGKGCPAHRTLSQNSNHGAPQPLLAEPAACSGGRGRATSGSKGARGGAGGQPAESLSAQPGKKSARLWQRFHYTRVAADHRLGDLRICDGKDPGYVECLSYAKHGFGDSSQRLQVDKHLIVSELGIHYRDLRIVDPLVATPYPASVFIRESALVVSLESLRMIICENHVSNRGPCLRIPGMCRPLSRVMLALLGVTCKHRRVVM